MTQTAIGQQAEQVAAKHIESLGYHILERNWRTRYCEIDIVAEYRKAIHFIEVKYRQRTSHGSGFDYVTPRKLKQMQFAAELWVQTHEWLGDYYLGAIEVSGPTFQVTNFLPDCS